MLNDDPNEWEHDPSRDGAGCGECGSFCQVNDELLCFGCHLGLSIKEFLEHNAQGMPQNPDNRAGRIW